MSTTQDISTDNKKEPEHDLNEGQGMSKLFTKKKKATSFTAPYGLVVHDGEKKYDNLNMHVEYVI